jgi:hypothetical protein
MKKDSDRALVNTVMNIRVLGNSWVAAQLAASQERFIAVVTKIQSR